MSNIKSTDKGKLLFNDYLSPKYDKMRRANRIMRYTTCIGALIGLTGLLIYPNDLFALLFLLSLISYCFIVLTEWNYKNTISVYENGIDSQCARPAKQGGWWKIGKRFIPFSEIESIYHRTDLGKPMKAAFNYSLGIMIVEIKIRNKNYVGFIPPASIGDVLPILEKHFGTEWQNIYKDPFKIRTKLARNQGKY